MNTKLQLISVLAASLALHGAAMPTEAEVEKAVPKVERMLASEKVALASGKMTRAEVAAAAMKLAADADDEAAKLLLMKGAFILHVKDGDLEKAVKTMNALETAIADMPPQIVTNIIETALLGLPNKTANGARLYRLLDEAKASAQSAQLTGGASGLYCVIDISGGEKAERYPVSYLDAVPEGGWTDEYKTTKIVLRRIDAGTWPMMGNRQVTFTKPFYIGIFELTQKQVRLLTGDDNRKFVFAGDMRPADNLTWNEMRGKNEEFDYPKTKEVAPESIIGKLRAKTGLQIDLPTSYQYGCAWNAGTDGRGRDARLTGRHFSNRNDGKGGFRSRHTVVGSYQANEWGIYDLHGNVWEMCLDYSGRRNAEVEVDPDGPAEGSKRRYRGGCWNSKDDFIFGDFAPEDQEANISRDPGKSGCRIVINVQADKENARIRLDPKKQQREAERAEQRAQLLAIQEEVKRVREAKAAMKDSSPAVRAAVESILKGMIKVPGRDYWLSATEVTQEQWEPIMEFNLSEHKGMKLPVECVSRNDCDVFLEKLNQTEEVLSSGFEFALPSRGEWQYATRAGALGDDCWSKPGVVGDVLEMAWLKENSSNQTHVVATKQPNAFGLYDMLGNVWEWTAGRDNEGRGCRHGGSYTHALNEWPTGRWICTPSSRRYQSCGLRLAAHKKVPQRPLFDVPKSIKMQAGKEAERLAKVDAAKKAVDSIKDAVTTWMISKKRSMPPATLFALVKGDGDEKSVLAGGKKALVDPWGNGYMWQVKSNRFAIISSGPDGKFGTDDDIRSEKDWNTKKDVAR